MPFVIKGKQQHIVQDKFILFIRTSRMNSQGKHVKKKPQQTRYFTDSQGLGQNIIDIDFFVSGFADLKKNSMTTLEYIALVQVIFPPLNGITLIL